MADEKRVFVGVRLPVELHERLLKEADARDVSMNWLANRAIVHFLDRLLPVDDVKWTRDG